MPARGHAHLELVVDVHGLFHLSRSSCRRDQLPSAASMVSRRSGVLAIVPRVRAWTSAGSARTRRDARADNQSMDSARPGALSSSRRAPGPRRRQLSREEPRWQPVPSDARWRRLVRARGTRSSGRGSAVARASWSSRLRLEVSTTAGRRRAVKVPSSGIVTEASPKNSNNSASNSSSARSISSIKRTGAEGRCEADRLEYRPFLEEFLGEQIGVLSFSFRDSARRMARSWRW